MSFSLETVERIYNKEELNFEVDKKNNVIRFSMDSDIASQLRFIFRIVNELTVMFKTLLPFNIPEKYRQQVSEYITRVNYEMLMGNFEMDFSDGEFSYKISLAFEEEHGIADDVILRLTYIGFNMMDIYAKGVFAIIHGGKTAIEAFEQCDRDF